jgi:glutamyl-tRNA synthetase
MKTRLAPSPTGSLHLGNARTFLINWALARRRGWKIVLRVEDLDGPRVKPEASAAILDILRWLGMDWDEGPYVQSDDLSPYREAIETLVSRGAVFPCALTRGEIALAASAPQEGAHELVYPSSLRPASWKRTFEPDSNWRMLAPDEELSFVDEFAGPQTIDLRKVIGDFVVWTKRGTPAYQLAVVVDDHRQGITHIVRGDDLLDSAARQLLIYRALGYSPEPSYLHLPLVKGPDGKRLAKRHGESRVESLRAAGRRPEDVVGLIAEWCGLEPGPRTAEEFVLSLDLSRIPKEPVVFRG